MMPFMGDSVEIPGANEKPKFSQSVSEPTTEETILA